MIEWSEWVIILLGAMSTYLVGLLHQERNRRIQRIREVLDVQRKILERLSRVEGKLSVLIKEKEE